MRGALETHRWVGRGASGGAAAGSARVLRDTADLASCRDGEIVLMRHATPSMAGAILGAAAVVCETGGILNHLAVLARELGTPCVTGVAGILDAIESGTELRVDGTRGVVETLAPGPDSASVVARPAAARDGLTPVLRFGRFSSTFACQEVVLTPRTAVSIAALADLPVALGFGDPLGLVFDGNRVLVADAQLKAATHALAARMESGALDIAAMRAAYEDACAWPGWEQGAATGRAALTRFVLLNQVTWAAALAKEELAVRLRALLATQLGEDQRLDDLLLGCLTTRGASYLVRRPAGPVALPPQLEAALDPGARARVRERAGGLADLVWLTERKNTDLARCAGAVEHLPIAATLGLADGDLLDDGSAAGRRAMVERVLARLPSLERPP